MRNRVMFWTLLTLLGSIIHTYVSFHPNMKERYGTLGLSIELFGLIFLGIAIKKRNKVLKDGK